MATMTDFEIALLERLDKIIEALEAGPRGRTVVRTKGGLRETTGVIERYDPPNDAGFAGAWMKGVVFATKNPVLIRAAEKAYVDQAHVRITFVMKKKGRYTNRYIDAVDVLPAVEEQPATPWKSEAEQEFV